MKVVTMFGIIIQFRILYVTTLKHIPISLLNMEYEIKTSELEKRTVKKYDMKKTLFY